VTIPGGAPSLFTFVDEMRERSLSNACWVIERPIVFTFFRTGTKAGTPGRFRS
jgi:hypothetical protein